MSRTRLSRTWSHLAVPTSVRLLAGYATAIERNAGPELEAAGLADAAAKARQAAQLLAEVADQAKAHFEALRAAEAAKPAEPHGPRAMTPPDVERPPQGYRIRTRTVTTRTATGLHRGPEVQVVGVHGRILARFDLESQAEAWIADQVRKAGGQT